MSAKRVAISTKPKKEEAAEAWVADRGQPEKMRRLTIDIPASLHGKIKAHCAVRGVAMADELRELLLDKYGKP